MEEKKEFEKIPFWLIPPVEYSTTPRLDNYIDIILSDIGEEGGRKTFFSYLTKILDYKNTQKNIQLKKVFIGLFESFRELKEKLKEGGLEKTSRSIEMQAPDKSGFGLIQYQGAHGDLGNFAIYRIIQRDLLLKIVKSTWRAFVERR
jgi:hypothetical protein